MKITIIRTIIIKNEFMLKIETWTENEILRKVSEEVRQNEIDSYIKLWNEMIRYIKDPDNRWVWLAAPQVWHNKRLIVVSLLKDREDESFRTIMMINPKILEKSNEIECENEWCLSVPWEKWKVERFKKIKLEYIDEKKKKQVLFLSWVSARIVQHEIDHLDWVLFTDKVID